MARIEERAKQAVADVVRRQVEAGVDVLNDGEQGKTGYATYVRERLTGFDGEIDAYAPRRPELEDHPDFAERWRLNMQGTALRAPACTGEIRLRDPEAVRRDLATLKAAARDQGVAEHRLFLSAASPGVIATSSPTSITETEMRTWPRSPTRCAASTGRSPTPACCSSWTVPTWR